MKSINILIFLSIISFIDSYGQRNIIPSYEIKSDTAVWTAFTHEYWQILEDKSEKLTFEEVSGNIGKSRFHDSLSGIDQNVNVYWVHYTLKNAMDRPAYISIDGNWDFSDTYIKRLNKDWILYKSGINRNWKDKNGYKYINMYPDTLLPSEELTIYQRLQSKTKGLPPNFAIGYLGTQTAIKTYYVDYLERMENAIFSFLTVQEGVVIGLLFLAYMLNLFFYTIVKEKEYLYFFLFAFFLSINRTFNIVSVYLLWKMPEYQGSEKFLYYSWVFIPLFLIQFFRYFLKIDVKYPKWSKFLLWLGILNFIVIGIDTFIRTNDSNNIGLERIVKFDISILPYLFIPLAIIITLSLYIKEKNTSIRLIIIGSIPFQFLYLYTHIISILLKNKFPEYFRLIELAALAWMIIFLTITLLLRYDELRKQNAAKQLENERLAKEKEIERNELIENQKIQLEKEVAERTAELKQSLEELRFTQGQLIQKEKLASLGELTAGIAHEIQNPLNFVNNFSELSVDLVKDLKEEIEKTDIDKEYVNELFYDLSQNQEKINHHGKRASSIVKGMLEHSRASTGVKELTDINKLADEYLRLAYHGLRAKDKDFNCDIKTDFDENLPKINIIPHDIGRVLLNLINNAFYAVNQKASALRSGNFQSSPNVDNYTPSVLLSTKQVDNQIIISVKDNGNGIPDNIKSKIFQPFFTTKPTGEGTGLGLSLSYDIVTKGHGGTLEVVSTEGVGVEFIVRLPI